MGEFGNMIALARRCFHVAHRQGKHPSRFGAGAPPGVILALLISDFGIPMLCFLVPTCRSSDGIYVN